MKKWFKGLLCLVGIHEWRYVGRRYYAYSSLIGAHGGRGAFFRKRKSKVRRRHYPTKKHVYECMRCPKRINRKKMFDHGVIIR